MNRYVLPALLAFVVSASGAAPEQGQLDGSRTLFTVMAALNAAGFDADRASPNNHPLREQVRAEVLRANPPSLPAIAEFFKKHQQSQDAAELNKYVSFALSVKGAPDFEFATRDVDVPPDAATLRELAPLLTKFYREANIEDLWKRSQPAIDQYIALYHAPVSSAVLQVNAYLRQLTAGYIGRRFQVYVELLAPPNQVQTRSYGYDYTIVVTPSPQPRAFDVRHAYLHYLLDPLATRNREVLERKKSIADHAQRAQALDEVFKEDFLQLATESLIKAIEARLDRKPAHAQQALRQGHILTPYFSECLPAYEKQEQAMGLYYPEMIKAIDLWKEDERLSAAEFDRTAAPGLVVQRPAPPPPPTGAAKTLEDAEKLYSARGEDASNLDRARKLYSDVLQQAQTEPLQAAAYYGLARIAVLQKDPAAAEQLFLKTVQLNAGPAIKAWALVYLGRLYQASQEPDEAAKYFNDALKVDGASESARRAATEALQSNSKK